MMNRNIPNMRVMAQMCSATESNRCQLMASMSR